MAKLKYTEDFGKRAEDLARQGLRDVDIAKKLGISKATFYEYQKTYPDFLDAIKRGKAPIDFEVENKLLKRAQGFDLEETHAEYHIDKKGKAKAFPHKIKKIKKHICPDVTAQIFWLKNRRPKIWRDRHNIDIDGNMSITVITAVPRPGNKEKKTPPSGKSPQGNKTPRVATKGTKARAPRPQPRSGDKKTKRKSAAGGRRRPESGAPTKKKKEKKKK